MALIKCPECGKEISDKSPACIHCGFPLELLKSSPSSGIDETTVEKDTDKDVEDDTLCEKGYSLELLDYGNKKVQVANATDSYTEKIKCPICGSPDIKKLSSKSKTGSIALWVIFSREADKQWRCNSCGSEW